MSHNEFMNIEEVANYLNVSISTVNRYMANHLLYPYKKDQSDKGKWIFHYEEVKKVKQSLDKPGLTTGEAAQELGVSSVTIHNYIKRGELRAIKQTYKRKNRYFILQEEINRFIADRDKQGKNFYDEKNNYYLYQPFYREQDGYQARLMSLEKEGEVQTENQTMTIQEAIENGYKPSPIQPTSDWITKMGYVVLSFQKKAVPMERVYQILETFYHIIGHKNIRIYDEKDRLCIEMKPCKIEDPSFREESTLSFLNHHLVEGRIELDPKGVLFESELSGITAHVPISVKEMIVEEAKKQNKSVNQYVAELLIKHHVPKEDTKQ
ncbi:helix-turn-helix domain-containing protein [Gracilibacillus sp. YIM 98692]|uniref:helix-turn-helix domain-containing protein n=1 Tax=Gracilibacillus sp. YIM 98692 TaxID=2663532 RepID=UPI001F0A0158|nr:helix-turn-helix domain-containing protein [Gracilibacillus sp. YIM 98692]